ncbi:alpha-helical pore-forming toxin family protein [Yersinia enterocolitica]|uniref:hypothetical protein n=2 Tax=Yersinia TaxID=629 RepID=UPI0005DB8709|nr:MULTISPECIES: hypothetical protein [Yersinia]EKN3732043.1 hypothetical protein [Yersinia enterocolitica]EKN3973001.1 hypothetical protein [Yersinia enterocolitica]EKN4034176.1 hypothetical protein [Yersinia enterocolitica]EKN5101079.1 hypothetical protein [Yersinia enterocolitica]EKN6209001.1 hypothetical protein [Yersinia enterocolitica]
MPKYKMDILNNAIDSLNESLDKYDQGQAGNIRQHKFALLHFCHFMELALKYYLTTKNENLIYKKVYIYIKNKAKSEKISLSDAYDKLEDEDFDFNELLVGDSNPFTITADQALAFIKSDDAGIDDELISEISAMKQLRNNIEHCRFEMDTKDVRLALGRLTRGFDQFYEYVGFGELQHSVNKAQLGIFQTLANEYDHNLSEAKADAQEAHRDAFRGVRLKHYEFVNFTTYDCHECNQTNLMIPNEESPSGYRCTHCGNEESDDIEVECEICGGIWPNGDMCSWEDTYDYTCPDCNDFSSRD